MTSLCPKLSILLLSPSETEKANITNFLHFWSKSQDIVTCLKQGKGIVKSKYLDVEESKAESATEKRLKTFSFQIEDAEKNKNFEIKLIYDAKVFPEENKSTIQTTLARKNDADGIFLALNNRGEFDNMFQSPTHIEDLRKTNPQLITLINQKDPDLENSNDVFCYWNDIFDVDPEILLKDSEKEKEVIEMNQKARETVLEIFQKLWSNRLACYEDHKAKMKKSFISHKFEIFASVNSDKKNRVKRIKSFLIMPSWGMGFKEQLKMTHNMKRSQPSLHKRMTLTIPGNPLKVSEAKMIRKNFAGLKSIKSLKLVWPYTVGSSPSCNRLVSKGLRNLSLLKKFTLEFTKYPTETNELESIEAALKKLKRLESLFVTFSAIPNLKQGDLCYFRDGLKRLKSLKEVDFNFNGTYNSMTESRMTDICEGLSRLSHIKGLKFVMHGSSGFGNPAMKILCDNLRLHTGLQRLSLDFSGTAVTNQGFQTFYRVLKELPCLKSLTLLFVRYETITHDNFREFCQVLRGLRDLEELNLNFSFCPLLTKESLDCLRDSLEKLIDVDIVSLLFVWCKKISFEDIKDLKKYLLALRPFKSLVARV